MQEHKVVIVGAGLVGSLLAIFLRQRGHEVHLYEKRDDMRLASAAEGRSINLVATSRGLHALDQVGLREEILKLTVPVYGRMMHDLQGDLTYQSYSKDDSACNYSISRSQLNCALLDQAEKAGAIIHFDHALLDLDPDTGMLTFAQGQVRAQRIFATDGAGSAVRQSLVAKNLLKDDVQFLSHGYKELLMPAKPDGSYPIDHRALHIWPRGDHMLMALPNLAGSLTMTLYLANHGETSFDALKTPDDVMAYFERYYADAIPLMPALTTEFFDNPNGLLGTVRTKPWHVGERILLMGDASHGIVPFFGQGMNSGFEDCTVLHELMNQHGDDDPTLFARFTAKQKANGDAIADMALENFVEMCDRVGDEQFLLQKSVEAKLGRAFPETYLSRYSMVTHSLIPYHLAQQAGEIQRVLLQELCASIDKPEQADLAQAQTLIQEKLTPFLQQHQITW